MKLARATASLPGLRLQRVWADLRPRRLPGSRAPTIGARSVRSVRPVRSVRSLRHSSPALAAVLVGLIVVLGLGWLWFRDSSFVSVKRVRITGVSGPNARQIERALRNAALSMSTLDVSMGQLRTAVAPFPDVRTLSVATQFPHGIVISVHEQVPIAAVTVDGRTIAVSGDGTLLQSPHDPAHLPLIPLRVPPGGSSLNEPGARAALSVLAAAPYGLLGHIANATTTAQNGVVVQLRRGPQLRFGPPTELAAKWSSALAVLGNPGSHGAQYIDVSDPRRPAAGVSTPGAASAAALSSASSGTASSASSTSSSFASSASSTSSSSAASSTAATPVGTTASASPQTSSTTAAGGG